VFTCVGWLSYTFQLYSNNIRSAKANAVKTKPEHRIFRNKLSTFLNTAMLENVHHIVTVLADMMTYVLFVQEFKNVFTDYQQCLPDWLYGVL